MQNEKKLAPENFEHYLVKKLTDKLAEREFLSSHRPLLPKFTAVVFPPQTTIPTRSPGFG